MMTSKLCLRLTATALTLGMTACDMGDEASDTDQLMVSSRDGGTSWGTGKLNTHFLGEDETLPFSAIPLADDPGADVRLHAVWTERCVGTGGAPLPPGLYYTSDLVGSLGITLNGEGKLNPARFKKYGDDGTTCTVAGNGWIGTVWGIMIDNGTGEWDNHYLMILGADTDAQGTPRYLWGRYVGGPGGPFSKKSYVPSCADYEVQVGEGLFHSNYAYLLKDLAVDDDSGVFSVAPDMMYIACVSGIVGKTAFWGYKPWKFGMDVHERATRVGRADYCGNGQPFTIEGNPLQIDDDHGVSEFDDLSFPIEAAWDLDGKATCVTTPRHIPLRGTTLSCGAETLEPCTDDDVTNAEFVTRIAHY